MARGFSYSGFQSLAGGSRVYNEFCWEGGGGEFRTYCVIGGQRVVEHVRLQGLECRRLGLGFGLTAYASGFREGILRSNSKVYQLSCKVYSSGFQVV